MPVRRASSFFASLEKFSCSRRPRRAAQCTARNINCEKIGMALALILSQPPAQYKQKSRGCHPSFCGNHGILQLFSANSAISMNSALNLLLRLTETIFQSPHRKVRLFLIDQERRRKAERVLARTEHEQTFVESQTGE